MLPPNLLPSVLLSCLLPAWPQDVARARRELVVREATQPGLALAPDGRTLYLAVLGDLVALDLAGGGARTLTSGPAYDAWPVATSAGLYFLSDRGAQGSEVMRLSARGELETLSRLGRELEQLAVAPDGAAFVALARRGRATELLGRRLTGEADAPSGLDPELSSPTLLAGGDLVALDGSVRGGQLVRCGPAGRRTVYRPESARDLLWAVTDPAGRFAVVHESGDWLDKEADFEETCVLDLERGAVLYRTPLVPYRDAESVETRAAVSSTHAYVPHEGAILAVELASGEARALDWEARLERFVPVRRDDPAAAHARAARWGARPGPEEVRPSADGERVVYSLLEDLYLVEKGGAPRRLTAGPERDSFPAFAPDGEAVWFARDGRLCRLVLDDGRVEPTGIALESEALDYHALAPDALAVLVSGSARAPSVIEIDLANGTRVERVARTGSWFPFPSYGAEGEIVYVADVGAGPQVYALAPGAGQPRVLTALERPPTRAAASPDGRWLALLRDGRVWCAERGEEPCSEAAFRPLGEVGAHSLAFDEHGRCWIAADRRVSSHAPDEERASASWDLSVALEPVAPAAPRLLLRGVHVLDLEQGCWQRDRDVLLAGGRIERIAAQGELQASDARVLELPGRYLVPGLFDLHVHDVRDATGALFAYGVTSVRQLGSLWPYQRVDALEIELGRRIGPRVLAAGEIFEGLPSWWGNLFHLLDVADEGQALLERRVEQGVAQLKFYPSLPRALRAPLVARAVALGVPTTAHAVTPRDIVTFLDDGGGCIEHFPEAAGFLARDLFALMALHGASWCPTLSVRGVGDLLARTDDAELAEPRFRAAVPEAHVAAWRRRQKVGGSSLSNLEALVDERCAAVVRAARMGVGVVVGSDASRGNAPVGPATHWELQALVRGGMTSLEALRAATSAPAQLLGLPEHGAVREGAAADLVVLGADPLADVRNARAVELVLARGLAVWP